MINGHPVLFVFYKYEWKLKCNEFDQLYGLMGTPSAFLTFSKTRLKCGNLSRLNGNKNNNNEEMKKISTCSTHGLLSAVPHTTQAESIIYRSTLFSPVARFPRSGSCIMHRQGVSAVSFSPSPLFCDTHMPPCVCVGQQELALQFRINGFQCICHLLLQESENLLKLARRILAVREDLWGRLNGRQTSVKKKRISRTHFVPFPRP